MTKQISELKFPVAVNIEGVTEDQYNKIYDILLQVGQVADSKDFNYYVVGCFYAHIGLTSLGYVVHYSSAESYANYTKDTLSVYTAEEFLSKFSDNKISLENSSKNVRKRPNMQRSSSKCVVYYTDGSSYTINNFQEIVETDTTIIIEYVMPQKKVIVEHGVVMSMLACVTNVEIDKEHLAGVVIKQQNGEDRIIRYSHLFASKQYVANRKNKVKAVERDNVYANVLLPEDVQPTGYKLADGTYSSQYKVGDEFVVITDNSIFHKTSVIALDYEDTTGSPRFRLLNGDGDRTYLSDNNTAYCGWHKLKAYTDS